MPPATGNDSNTVTGCYGGVRSYFGQTSTGDAWSVGWGDNYGYYGTVDTDWHYFNYKTQADYDMDVFLDSVNQNGDGDIPISTSSFYNNLKNLEKKALDGLKNYSMWIDLKNPYYQFMH